MGVIITEDKEYITKKLSIKYFSSYLSSSDTFYDILSDLAQIHGELNARTRKMAPRFKTGLAQTCQLVTWHEKYSRLRDKSMERGRNRQDSRTCIHKLSLLTTSLKKREKENRMTMIIMFDARIRTGPSAWTCGFPLAVWSRQNMRQLSRRKTYLAFSVYLSILSTGTRLRFLHKEKDATFVCVCVCSGEGWWWNGMEAADVYSSLTTPQVSFTRLHICI